MRPTLIALVGAALLSGHSLSVAETFSLGNDTIRFDPGPQYCALQAEKHEFDRLMIQHQRSATQGLSTVVGMFMKCENLKASRQGDGSGIGQYGILIALSKEQPPRKLAGYTRSKFLIAMRKRVGNIEVDARAAQSRLDRAMREIGIEGNVKLGENRQLGALLLDDVALYTGLVMTYEAEGEIGTTGGVSGMTLVKDYTLMFTLYRDLVDTGTINLLLKEQTDLLRKLVSQNEPLE